MTDHPGRPAITTESLTVDRHARVALIGDPAQATEAWLILHGYGMTARGILHWFEAAAAPQRLLVAPEALSRFYENRRGVRVVGASWLTAEDRLNEIEDQRHYLDAVASRWLSGRVRVELHGFSQGVSVAFRWAATSGNRIDRLVGWAGVLPPELDISEFSRHRPGLGVDLVVGDADPRVAPASVAEDAARLRQGGVEVRLHRFDGGHSIPNGVLATLAG